MIELLGDALETETAHNLVDHILLGKLRATRDYCIEERDRLNAVRIHREWRPHEAEDWTELVFDIQALNRVIDYYGG
jgi:hypothetical protein